MRNMPARFIIYVSKWLAARGGIDITLLVVLASVSNTDALKLIKGGPIKRAPPLYHIRTMYST